MNPLAFLLLTATLAATATAAELPVGYKLLYEQNFATPAALNDFVFTDPKGWRHSKTNGQGALELFAQNNYKPKHRSPVNFALLADKVFGDFILEVELLSTVKPYGHQDMCLFFGFQEPTKYYYNHIAVAADANAHNIFLVNEAPRKNFAKETTKGITWGQNVWHKIRLERSTADGSIRTYFDDFTKPLMIAEDKTFTRGHLGFGSFDDLGKITNIKIWGPAVETKKTEFFQPLPKP